MTYGAAYTESNIPALVKDAIRHANWFPEHDERLRDLASSGKADEIRAWAKEIRADWPGDSEDAAYWQDTAADWDRVADAVEGLTESLVDA